MNLAQNVCLDDFLVKFETGSPGVKQVHKIKSKENLINYENTHF